MSRSSENGISIRKALTLFSSAQSSPIIGFRSLESMRFRSAADRFAVSPSEKLSGASQTGENECEQRVESALKRFCLRAENLFIRPGDSSRSEMYIFNINKTSDARSGGADACPKRLQSGRRTTNTNQNVNDNGNKMKFRFIVN